MHYLQNVLGSNPYDFHSLTISCLTLCYLARYMGIPNLNVLQNLPHLSAS